MNVHVVMIKHFYSRFSCNCEANASELQENFDEILRDYKRCYVPMYSLQNN